MIYLPISDGDSLEAHCAYMFVRGRTSNDAIPDPSDALDSYFWRGFFEAHGTLRIYGEMSPGFVPSPKNTGPRARIAASAPMLREFLAFLESHGPDYPSSASQFHQCSAGRLTFGAQQTVSLVRCLYDDELLATDPTFMETAARIYAGRPAPLPVTELRNSPGINNARTF